MILTNNYKYAPKGQSVGELIKDSIAEYDRYMETYHTEAFRTAKRYKVQTNLVDEEGFIRLEPVTRGSTQYLDLDHDRSGYIL